MDYMKKGYRKHGAPGLHGRSEVRTGDEGSICLSSEFKSL